MTYTDPSGAVRLRKVKGKDLSASWVLENPNTRDQQKNFEVQMIRWKKFLFAETFDLEIM